MSDLESTLTKKDFPVNPIWVLKVFFYSFTIMLPIIGPVFLNSDGAIPYILFLVVDMVYKYISLLLFDFQLDKEYLNVKQGIISRQSRSTPFGVIQQIIIKQDIFDRIFKLKTLIIENAANAGGMKLNYREEQKYDTIYALGSKHNKVVIPGLSLEHADMLKRKLLQKMKEHPGPTQTGL